MGVLPQQHPPHQGQEGHAPLIGDSLLKVPTLRDLATAANAVPAARVDGRDGTELAQKRAAARISLLENLAERSGEMSEMDFDFLYDGEHKLLSIGYNVDTHQKDPGFYDLLASEARLCSFLGIARGQLPLEHWFHLGRQLAPGGRAAVLISWSGSMFEYLMPLLLMPNYDATLLDQSCREAVRRQVRYGQRHGLSNPGPLANLLRVLSPWRRNVLKPRQMPWASPRAAITNLIRKRPTSTGLSECPGWDSSKGCTMILS